MLINYQAIFLTWKLFNLLNYYGLLLEDLHYVSFKCNPCIWDIVWEAYSEPCQASEAERFVFCTDFWPLTTFANCYILDVWRWFEYASQYYGI